MSFDFTTTTYGKWILAGEHAVLRGHAALVFPIKEKTLQLSFQSSEKELNAEFEGSSGSDMHLLFWSVLEHGQHLLGRSLNHLSGHFHLHSNIPVGVGLGASAALCVAMARWFAHQNFLKEQTLFSFAQELEHLFHGKSSGLDIAGVSAEQGIYFQNGETSPVMQTWQPHWYLSSCGQIGMTSHCIAQVRELWETNPQQATLIDQKMNEQVKAAELALAENSTESLQKLAESIRRARECFSEWGLVSETLASHMQQLLDLGALAVKPTGSGGGGYVVSLWDKVPPDMPIEIIKA